MPEITNSIFGQYDIRGTYGKNLNENFAYLLGYSLKYFSKYRQISVARDGRLSSFSLFKYLTQGLERAGFIIYDIGVTTSPILYYATKKLKTNCGIMITASHNPPSDNGFKIIVDNQLFCGENLKKLEIQIEETKKLFAENCKKPKLLSKKKKINNFNSIYLNYLKDKFDFSQIDNLTVVWDPGNGAACLVIKKLLKFLPGTHIIINEEINGRFPNRSPNPMVKANLSLLSQKIKEKKANFGIAFDGDGDRIAILDEKGDLVQGDFILLLFAEFLQQYQPQLKVIIDIKTSQLVLERLDLLKIQNLMWKTGHSNIKSKMAEIDGCLAGEITGHFYFKDNYYFDDAIYAALKFCLLFSKLNICLSEYIKRHLPKIKASEELRLFCGSEDRFSLVENLKQILSRVGKNFSDLDGIRYRDKRGWWLIRASNTENCLSIRYEIYQEIEAKQFKEELNELLSNINLKIE